MNTHVVLYTKQGCGPCAALEGALRRAEIDYEKVDLSANEEARQHLQALGYQQAPVIIAGNLHWSGINPEKLNRPGIVGGRC